MFRVVGPFLSTKEQVGLLSKLCFLITSLFMCVSVCYYAVLCVFPFLENVLGVQIKLRSFLDLTQNGTAEVVLQQVSHTFRKKVVVWMPISASELKKNLILYLWLNIWQCRLTLPCKSIHTHWTFPHFDTLQPQTKNVFYWYFMWNTNSKWDIIVNWKENAKWWIITFWFVVVTGQNVKKSKSVKKKKSLKVEI